MTNAVFLVKFLPGAIIYADKTEAFANVAREAAHAVQKEMAGYLHDKGIIPCKA